SLLRLRRRGWRFVMVTNQDGLGTPAFPRARYELCQAHVLALFRSQGIEFEEIFVCPHRANERCACRKPRTGLLTRFLAANTLDLGVFAVVVDRDSDLQRAAYLGVRGLRIGAGTGESGPEFAAALDDTARRGAVERATRETSLRVQVELDADKSIAVATGIGFLDHMLEQVAKHGGFGLA